MKVRASPAAIIALAIGAVLLLYSLSWGPVVYLLIKYEVSETRWPGRMFIYVFYPHLRMMAESEHYFRYSIWWGEKAQPGVNATTWADFQREFDRFYR